jgi:dynactin-4
MPKNAPPANHHLHISTQHFTVNAFKDAWAYDEDEEDEDVLPALEGSEGLSEEGSALGTLGRRSRKSLLMTGSTRDKKRSDGGVEKKGNVSKVGLEVEVSQGASGRVEVGSTQSKDTMLTPVRPGSALYLPGRGCG